MNKICTTIEQSKKLIELGVDVNTADMYWWYGGKIYYVEAIDDGDFNKESDTPAWSLSALLELIPNWQMQTQDNGIGILYCCKEEIKIIEGETPLDAAFQMVVLLKENGKI